MHSILLHRISLLIQNNSKESNTDTMFFKYSTSSYHDFLKTYKILCYQKRLMEKIAMMLNNNWKKIFGFGLNGYEFIFQASNHYSDKN